MEWIVHWLDRADSTNTRLKEMAGRTPRPPDGFVLAAREQTAGRGRMNRAWMSRPGRDLCFSALWPVGPAFRHLPSLGMAAALAVDDALKAMGIHSRLKWPNDVLVGDRKIAGILIETVRAGSINRSSMAQADTPLLAVIGIGLNVNMTAGEASQIDRPATSLRILTGRDQEIGHLLQTLLERMEPRLNAWAGTGFLSLRSDWEARATPAGLPLTVHDGGIRTEGVVAGYGIGGELLLEDSTGAIRAIWSGDTTTISDRNPSGSA